MWRVSSAQIAATLRNVSSARGDRSPRLPIGVATTWSVPGGRAEPAGSSLIASCVRVGPGRIVTGPPGTPRRGAMHADDGSHEACRPRPVHAPDRPQGNDRGAGARGRIGRLQHGRYPPGTVADRQPGGRRRPRNWHAAAPRCPAPRGRPTTTRSTACCRSSTMPRCSREAAALPVGEPLYNYAGRALLRRGLPLPRPFDRTAWKFDAGKRPPAESDGYRPPVKLAVLLPLSGNLAVAASPVRDGLLAGYYGEQRRRPDVVFYDTAGTAERRARRLRQGRGRRQRFRRRPAGSRRSRRAVRQRARCRCRCWRSIAAATRAAVRQRQLLAVAGRRRTSPRPSICSTATPSACWWSAAPTTTQRRAVAALRERLGERGARRAPTSSAKAPPTSSRMRSKEGGVDAVFLAVQRPHARAC